MTSLKLSAVLAVFLFSASISAAPVNINTASASDIASSLNGVGISKAQAIVNYRKQNGKFKKSSDIVQVKGIGNATFEKNKADILIK